MNAFVQFGVLGLATGSLYAFAAQGLVLIYRSSQVVNFAAGAIGIGDAFIFNELAYNLGWGFWPALVLSLLIAAAFGVAFYAGMLRRLRKQSGLIRVVATLGLLTALQGVFGNIYNVNAALVPIVFPVHVLHIGGSIQVPLDRVALLGVTLVMTTVLWAIYRFSWFGLGTTAIAENPRAAEGLGWSFNRIAGANWGVGCVLTSLAAILLVPYIALSVSDMTALLLVTLAAALVGNMQSFMITTVAGLAIGVVQGEINYYAQTWGRWSSGLSESIPFFVIIAVMLIRGQSLPARDYTTLGYPTVGSGKLRLIPAAIVAIGALCVAAFGSDSVATALASTAQTAIILLAVVVLTGYAGQISLAVVAVASFGAIVAGPLYGHLPFVASVIVAAILTFPVGALVAILAVRARGFNLAIATLGLGECLQVFVFPNPWFSHLISRIFGQPALAYPQFFGMSLSQLTHPQRWAVFCVVFTIICSAIVVNLRRGRVGRRLLAVRLNERAAAALGVSVAGTKIYAFGLAGAIGAVGAVLAAFSIPGATTLTNDQSPTFVALAVIGGVGFLAGPLIGALLATGSLGYVFVGSLFGQNAADYLQTFSGLLLLAILLWTPNGLASGFPGLASRIRRSTSAALESSPAL